MLCLAIAIPAFLSRKKSQVEDSKAADTDFINYGKGLIYYTENYIRDYNGVYQSGNDIKPFNEDDLPVTDERVSEFANNPQMIRGNDCSRYIDLTNREISYFKDLGLKHVILGWGAASWYNIAKSRPADATDFKDTAYNFGKLDRWVGLLQTNNIIPVLQIWGTPTWASNARKPGYNPTTKAADCNQEKEYHMFEPYNRPSVDSTDYANFMTAVAKRYNGTNITNPFNSNQKLKVDTFSLWNEPNVNSFWQSGHEAEFVAMHNNAYNAIKNVRSDSKVWGVNLSAACCDAKAFTERNLSKLKFDILSVHPYPTEFNNPPQSITPNNSPTYSIDYLSSLIQYMDTFSQHKDKKVMLSEIGYRTVWEHRFTFKYNDQILINPMSKKIEINEDQKASYLNQTLSLINYYNRNGNTANRIIGADNNVLYTPWRWWSSGLINYQSDTDAPINSLDAAYPDKNGGLTIVKDGKYWYRSKENTVWKSNTLQNSYCNVGCVGVPVSNPDTIYSGWDNDSLTVIKGDRYWYRPNSTSNWYTNTLQSAFYNKSGNKAQELAVPINGIQAAYFGANNSYTLIKGDRYWYRANPDAEWYSNTLQSAYYNVSSAVNLNIPELSVPKSDVDAAYFDKDGGYTIIKGDRYWYRPNPNAQWSTNLLWSVYNNMGPITFANKIPAYNTFKNWTFSYTPPTSTPTRVPNTSTPTKIPNTATPTKVPATSTPTKAPATSTPTNVPSTPTKTPNTATPTKIPSTNTPTPISYKRYGDLNGDKKVDIIDLSILARFYGTSNSNGDVDGNGSVNIIDLSILASNYGRDFTKV